MEQTSFKVLKNGFENNLIAPAKGDVGWDLIASSDPEIVFCDEKKKSILYIEYDTGVVLQPTNGFYTLLFPRSSISKYELALANSVGVIDSGYRNTIKLRFRFLGKRLSKNSLIYKKGDKVGQLIFMPMFNFSAHQTEVLDESERGLSAFGERTGL